jgi:hypothetical protein
MQTNTFRFLAIFAAVCVPLFASACDICGCAGGSNSMGLLPLMQRHFVGFRWQAQGFKTDAHGSESNSTESFRTIDIWGRWHPHRRVQVIASLPFQFSERHFDDGTKIYASGLGDAAVLVQFALLDPRKQSVRDWQHAFQIGGGVKLPSGKTDLADTEQNKLLPALQPGTGSTDFLVSSFYALRHGKWGASLDATARLMTQNKDAFQAGHRVNSNLRVFWTKKSGKTTFLPFGGLLLDARSADRDNGTEQNETGGWGAFGTAGVDILRKNLSFSLGWQIPLESDFSNGRVVPQNRFNAAVALLFGGKSKMEKIVTPMVFPNVEK